MKTKKYVASTVAVLALLINAPQVSADDEDYDEDEYDFGDELIFLDLTKYPEYYEQGNETIPDKEIIDTPIEDTPVEETPDTPVENVDDDTLDAPFEDVIVEENIDTPIENAPVEENIDTPVESTPVNENVDTSVETAPVEKNIDTVVEIIEDGTLAAPFEDGISKPVINPLQNDNEFVDKPFGDIPDNEIETEPVDNNLNDENDVTVVEDIDFSKYYRKKNDNDSNIRISNGAKARFVKLASDSVYDYYLDKQGVSWKRVPYSSSEYMADVWIRKIENNPEDANYAINEELEMAKQQNATLNPVDYEVLKHGKYFIENYYLRPKTNQMQYIGTAEVSGIPQDSIDTKPYDYKNWQEPVPGSIRYLIYNKTLKEIGTGKASDKGHMKFVDALEEYARISLR